MNKYLLPMILTGVISIGCANAETVKWLDDGSVVHTIDSEDTVAKRSASSDNLTVTLASGQDVVLTGGVYVKAEDTSKVLAWALTNGYVALEDKYIKGAVTIQTTPVQSIAVANAVAEIEGVTTAAPKYRTKLVPK